MTALTAWGALDTIIKAMTPDADARSAASRHRSEVESWLKADLDIVRMRETGSWHHGTAVDGHSDVDYFVTMSGSRPNSSLDTLNVLRDSLQRGLTGFARVNRPAVQVEFFDGSPKVEITPAYYRDTDDYWIPDPDGSGWIKSNPAVHLAYVNSAQEKTDGRAKGLIRLVKTWKARRGVPLSSFYLEMRTAQYAPENKPILWDWDLAGVLRALQRSELASMNDPTDYGRRISCGATGLGEAITAKMQLDEAVRLAAAAHDAAKAENHQSAVQHILNLFNFTA